MVERADNEPSGESSDKPRKDASAESGDKPSEDASAESAFSKLPGELKQKLSNIGVNDCPVGTDPDALLFLKRKDKEGLELHEVSLEGGEDEEEGESNTGNSYGGVASGGASKPRDGDRYRSNYDQIKFSTN